MTPDCDWKDKKSKRGCRERSVFVLFLRGPSGALERHKFYACRSHASDLWREAILPLASRWHTPTNKVTPCCYDLALLAEYEKQQAKLASRIIKP